MWQRLAEMEPPARDAFLSRAEPDPDLVAAVMHVPKAFALGSEDARRKLLDNYNRAHRADKVAMREDLEPFISAVTNYRSMVLRALKDALK